MVKKLVVGAFIFLMLGVLFIASDMKNAYKWLPGPTQADFAVPLFADWRDFLPQTGKFKVSLPAPPQYASEEVAIPKTDKKRHYDMYVSEQLNGTTFMISLISYPPNYDMGEPSLLLRDIVDELMEGNPTNRLDSFQKSTFNGQEGADFSIHNDELVIYGKEFLLKRTLYLLTYIARKRDFNLNDYNHFIESFQLVASP